MTESLQSSAEALVEIGKASSPRGELATSTEATGEGGGATDVWLVPGPRQLWATVGWPVAVAWLYVVAAALFNVAVAARLLIHLWRHKTTRTTQLVVNSLAVLSYPLTAVLCAAVTIDPRFQPLLDVTRDLWVGTHLTLIGLTLLACWDSPQRYATALQQLWDAQQPPAWSSSCCSAGMRRRLWWLLEPERHAGVYTAVSLLCLLQYPLVLAAIQGHLISGMIGPLLADPQHYLWPGVPPTLNALATMSFWLCFIGRNNFYKQPFPVLDWGDVMRDRERTLFLVLDFNWLQTMVSQLFPQVGLRLAGMNEYTTFSVLLHAVIVLQLAVAVLRVDRFWREPLVNGATLPPIGERCAARERHRLATITPGVSPAVPRVASQTVAATASADSAGAGAMKGGAAQRRQRIHTD